MTEIDPDILSRRISEVDWGDQQVRVLQIGYSCPTIHDLLKLTPHELPRAFPNVGIKTCTAIAQTLRRLGLTFKPDHRPLPRWYRRALAAMEPSMTEIVAEISGNHGGVLNNALRLILDANEAGADAVKFQCFDPVRLALRRASNPEVLALAGGTPLVDLYRKTWTPQVWFPDLIAHARMYKLNWFSSVFDPADVGFLELLGCPRYKISAFEMLDWDIIKAVRETGKPIVVSVRPRAGLTIMQATDYAGRSEPLGLSAHGRIAAPPGAPMVEYHLKLDGVETPDSGFSLTMEELKDAVSWIRR